MHIMLSVALDLDVGIIQCKFYNIGGGISSAFVQKNIKGKKNAIFNWKVQNYRHIFGEYPFSRIY